MDDPARRSAATWRGRNLDHAAAFELLARHLPAADHACLEPLGHGDFCLAFAMNDRVLRIARHAAAAAALRREACVLAQIAPALPIPVPRLSFFAPAECPAFTIHAAIKGEVLTRAAWESMPAAARLNAALDVASFLQALHALPSHIGFACGVERIDVVALAQRLRSAVAGPAFSPLTRATRVRLSQLLAKNADLPGQLQRQPVLLHCDVAPGHLFFDPATGNLTGVIDFGDVAIGDVARDFIYIYDDFGAGLLDDVAVHYAGPGAPALVAEVRTRFLLDVTGWTHEMWAAQNEADRQIGLATITREVAALEDIDDTAENRA